MLPEMQTASKLQAEGLEGVRSVVAHIPVWLDAVGPESIKSVTDSLVKLVSAEAKQCQDECREAELTDEKVKRINAIIALLTYCCDMAGKSLPQLQDLA